MTIIIKTNNRLLLGIVNLFKNMGAAEVEASDNRAQDLANFEAFKFSFRSALKEMREENNPQSERLTNRKSALAEISQIEEELKAEGYE